MSAPATEKVERFAAYGLPFLVFCLAIAGWEALVRFNNIEPYILPAPSLVAQKASGAPCMLPFGLNKVIMLIFSVLFKMQQKHRLSYCITYIASLKKQKLKK